MVDLRMMGSRMADSRVAGLRVAWIGGGGFEGSCLKGRDFFSTSVFS